MNEINSIQFLVPTSEKQTKNPTCLKLLSIDLNKKKIKGYDIKFANITQST